MFRINYQITNKTEELKSLSKEELDRCYIEGNIEITVNDKKYGYYKKEPLEPEEEGFDLLTDWFDELVNALLKLKQKHEYVALYVIDTYATWIEFKRLNDKHVSIGIIKYKAPYGTDLVITTEPHTATPSNWVNEVITYDELQSEILLKMNQYINELTTINKSFATSKALLQLKQITINNHL
jgi:hypothetical protein